MKKLARLFLLFLLVGGMIAACAGAVCDPGTSSCFVPAEIPPTIQIEGPSIETQIAAQTQPGFQGFPSVTPETTQTPYNETPEGFSGVTNEPTQFQGSPTSTDIGILQGQSSDETAVPTEDEKEVKELCLQIENSLPWGTLMPSSNGTDFFGTLGSDPGMNNIVNSIANILGENNVSPFNELISIGVSNGSYGVHIFVINRQSPVNDQTLVSGLYAMVRSNSTRIIEESGMKGSGQEVRVLIVAYLSEEIIDAIILDLEMTEVPNVEEEILQCKDE